MNRMAGGIPTYLVNIADPEFPVEISMMAVAMADDLTIIANNRTDLQRAADIVAEWYEAVGITVNAQKTVHVSYTNQTSTRHSNEPAPLHWNQGTPSVQIESAWDPSQPLRVLGMRLIPDGNTKSATEELCRLSEAAVKPLKNKIITDRMVQYVVRTCIIPAIEYYATGLPLTPKKIEDIAQPIMKAVKHGYGVPSTASAEFFYCRKVHESPPWRTN
ncbi:hypothetical protein GGI23_004412 [Coemansia sp. RSA 2559]|nr:hypothetical protein GGI23_004412 [Coemansia sp. RSA 2559]